MIKVDWLAEYGLTLYALSTALRIPNSRMTEIIKGRQSITADTALRLAWFYGNTAQFCLNLHARYDLEVVDAAKIEVEVVLLAA